MSFKQMIQDDLDVFYNTDEFGTSAELDSKPIVVLFLDDLEIESSSQILVSAKSSDVIDMEIGNTLTIENIDFKITNFDDKDSTKLEQLIALTKI